MEMDLGSTIIGVVSIVLFMLPFVLLNRGRKKREKVLLQSLNKIASQHKCKIKKHEIFNNFIIGFDDSQNILFYYNRLDHNDGIKVIDLKEIESCKVVITNRTYNNRQGSQRIVDKLELCFYPYVQVEQNIHLVFFNSDLNMQLSGELQSIENWSKYINDRLKHH